MPSHKKLTIVIPARNEEQIISKTLAQIDEEIGVPYNLIVVDDHSTDRTEEVVKNTAKKNKNISLISNNGSPGFANTVILGLKTAARNSNYVLPMMADLCDDPKTIPLMLNEMEKGYDIVCGSRYMAGGRKIGEIFIKDFFSRSVGYLTRAIIGVKTWDITNSFKMYRVGVLKDPKINLKSKGFTLSMELPLKAHFLGYVITEVPTTWVVRKEGKSKFLIFKMAAAYFKLFSWAVLKKLKII